MTDRQVLQISVDRIVEACLNDGKTHRSYEGPWFIVGYYIKSSTGKALRLDIRANNKK